MDNLLEILLPLIFFAIYFASQFFGKKDEDEPTREEEPDSMRKIREELRRKIEERRKGDQQGPQQQQQRETEKQPEERAGGAVLRESRQRTGHESTPEPPTQPKAPRPAPSPSAQPSYDQDLEERMAEVRRSQEKVEAARRQARERIGSLAAAQSASSKPKNNTAASYREFLRQSLHDPENLRKSFLLHEVFGTPVGMREGGKMRPSWDL